MTMLEKVKVFIQAPTISNGVKDVLDRLNTHELYTILLIIMVGFGSFGLGRLSKLQEGKSPVRIEQALATQSASALSASPAPAKKMGATPSVQQPLAPGGELIASKGGTKYHFPWCSGAQRISEANKLRFKSVEEARKAGYTPASNCKGLK